MSVSAKPQSGDEQRRLARLERLAFLLDNALPIPGTRFRIGLDPFLGLVPGLGDAIGAVTSGYVLLEAARFGVPRSVLLRMFANVAFDTVLGAVPGIGDLFDFGWKAHAKNLALLRRHLRQPAATRRASRRLLLGLLAAIALLAAAVIVGMVALVRFMLDRLAV